MQRCAPREPEYGLAMRAFLDTSLNVAVLMQLAGIECWRYSASLGLLLIVVGGALYRQEMRRARDA